MVIEVGDLVRYEYNDSWNTVYKYGIVKKIVGNYVRAWWASNKKKARENSFIVTSDEVSRGHNVRNYSRKHVHSVSLLEKEISWKDRIEV